MLTNSETVKVLAEREANHKKSTQKKVDALKKALEPFVITDNKALETILNLRKAGFKLKWTGK